MLGLRKSDLLAARLAPGPIWLDLIQEAWDCGAAVLPVDHRLSEAEAAHIYKGARPTVILEDPQSPVRLSSGRPVDSEVALVVATSGTTGAPKLVELTHAAIKAAVEASSARLECTKQDPWLCCLPLAHMGGMLVLLRCILLGAPLVVQPRFDAESFEREQEARFTSLVPTMLFRLLETGADLTQFKAILIGGAALNESLHERARQAGAKIVGTYGLTETCGGVVYDGIPLPGTEIRIAEQDEIQLRGPTIMRGYRLDPQTTQRCITEDGWLRTNDAGTLESGRLRIAGRLDHRIRTGGETVWPSEVETVLSEHPKIQNITITGAEDPEWGEKVVAHIVPADPASPPSLEEVRSFAAAKLARYKLPHELVIVSSTPGRG
jgi:o-succinylbenzoate---CoA ligase